ncbi:MAG: hypothetical protein JWR52_1004 [Marmoricola sp.]|nr:hypothetical protein [Marmoricola sp.]
MRGRLALIGAVGVAWLITFVLLGGNVLPSIGGHRQASSPPTNATPGALYPNPTPIGPPTATPSPSAGPSGSASTASLAELIARTTPLAGQTLVARPAERRSTAPVLQFRMATYNVQGSSHTQGNPRRASGVARITRGAQYVVQNGLTIVGFQEMQTNQRAAFTQATQGAFGLYPDNHLRNSDGDNSIAWRLDTWDLVKAASIRIEYFGGANRNMPILLLRNKQTGIEAYFTNFHNPADVYGPAGQYRAVDKLREIALFNQLARTGLPVFVTGDMNEHRTWACDIVTATTLHVAAGGDGRHGCTVTDDQTIDWIGASDAVGFENYYSDRSALVRALTDHPINSTDVTINAADFPRSLH